MGNVTDRADHGHRASNVQLEKLFMELSVEVSDNNKKKQILDAGKFKAYFSGHDKQFGHDLCVRLFGRLDDPPLREQFVTVMKDVEEICQRDPREIIAFTFSILANQSDSLPAEILPSLFKRSFQYGVILGLEEEDHSDPSTIIKSLTASVSQHLNKEDGRMHLAQFTAWSLRHCPSLFDGTRHWILSCIHGEHGQHTHSAADAAHDSNWMPYYQLPVLSAPPNSVLHIDGAVLWMLSISLPSLFMGGHHKHHSSSEKPVDYPVGGEWSLLYSSAANGFSLNRFLHHCSDYRGPSVMLLCYRDDESVEHLLALAVDVEWRGGTFYWGNQHCRLLEIQPFFSVIADGAKRVSLNEKERGFPQGLRVMSEPDGHGSPILHVPSTFDSLQIRDGQSYTLAAVEVWGCGGMEVAALQQKQKAWEKKEIARRIKVKRDALEAWEDNPDRHLLNWVGVSTSSSQEQQQQ
ncbi:uncharacterized protein [Dysidea avara]|uniref:uncharacterized protein n=1 Tax=Dysidea avara TaxID=196820 RepID=UPI003322C9A0